MEKCKSGDRVSYKHEQLGTLVGELVNDPIDGWVIRLDVMVQGYPDVYVDPNKCVKLISQL